MKFRVDLFSWSIKNKNPQKSIKTVSVDNSDSEKCGFCAMVGLERKDGILQKPFQDCIPFHFE